MKSAELTKKVRLLEAIAAGHSCEQVLAGDCTLTYHDIFRAVAEPPTAFWKKKLVRRGAQSGPDEAESVPKLKRYRVD